VIQDQGVFRGTERRDVDCKDDSERRRGLPGLRNAAEMIVRLVPVRLNVVGDASADPDADQSVGCQEPFQAQGHDCRSASGAMAFVAVVVRRVVHQRDAQLAAANQSAPDDFAVVRQSRVALPERDRPDDSPVANHPDEWDVVASDVVGRAEVQHPLRQARSAGPGLQTQERPAPLEQRILLQWVRRAALVWQLEPLARSGPQMPRPERLV